MTKNIWIVLILNLWLSASVSAATDPAALKCVEDSLDEYDKILSYKAIINKKEWEKNKLRTEQKISVEHTKPSATKITFLNQGNTGIKNNGMVIEYHGKDSMKVQLGSTRGLGFLAKGAAQLAVGDEISLIDSQALDDEYFTVNRVPFTHLTRMLKKNMESLKNAKDGGLALYGEGCKIRYTKHTDTVIEKTITSQYTIFSAEEEYGTLAFLLLPINRDQFSDLFDLLNHSKGKKIKIPLWYPEMEIELDAKNKLPSRLAFYAEGKPLAEYTYSVEEIKHRE